MKPAVYSLAAKAAAALAVIEFANGRAAGGSIMLALFFLVRILSPPIDEPPQ